MKYKRFWFHYNKPISSKVGKPQISLHFNKTCYIVDNIICKVPTEGRIRKQQPRFIVAGRAKSIEIIDNIGYIR